eukprot:TRINITY_DN19386_c0_g5_i1.p1 TRINITY_DN19386_c0_g5~~TRINITY_DN19386_c0_g5_i1.p1  ORF type:complete len:553 (-),score=26.21 TRINITY_DN19386_c0_g5_i1:409-2067(-)
MVHELSLPLLTLEGDDTALPTSKNWTAGAQRARARLRLERGGYGTSDNEFRWPWLQDVVNCTVSIHGTSSAVSSVNATKQKFSYSIDLGNESYGINAAFGRGWNPDSTFVLYGPRGDRSLVRNAFMYSLSNAIGRWAPHFAFVELNIQDPGGQPEYVGVYVLIEAISAARLGIQSKEGSFIVNYDRSWKAPSGHFVWPSGSAAFYMVDGSETELFRVGSTLGSALGLSDNDTEMDRVTSVGCSCKEQTSCVSGSYRDSCLVTDPGCQNSSWGYCASHNLTMPDMTVLDVRSAVDVLLLQELASNPDAYAFSSYLHSSPSDMVEVGPIWDYDIALGNCHQPLCCSGFDSGVDHWQWAHPNHGLHTRLADFYQRMLTDPNSHCDFRDHVRGRWAQLRRGLFSDASLTSRVKMFTELLKRSNAATRNFDLWPLNEGSFTNPSLTSTSYASEVDHLDRWILRRARFLDAAFDISAPCSRPLRPDFCLRCKHPIWYPEPGYESQCDAADSWDGLRDVLLIVASCALICALPLWARVRKMSSRWLHRHENLDVGLLSR